MARRVTFVGASPLAIQSAQALLARGHEVVLIDEDPDKIHTLSERLDCGLIVGDGSRPSVLEEVGPEQTDFLFCVTDRDEANILSALVGRSLGFSQVVPKLEDPDLETICTELGLDHVLVPDHELAQRLVDLVEGGEIPDLTSVIRGGLRFFAFSLHEDLDGVEALELPAGARLLART
jgi:trk system potassium uptake protein TrkA